MKEWGLIIAAVIAVLLIIRAIYNSSAIVSRQLDELKAKIDALEEKLDSIESTIEAQDIDAGH